MGARVRIVAEGSSFRMIHCQAYGYAVVEVRNGYVYSTDPHHARHARDDSAGMEAVATESGWISELEARRQFDSLVQTGQHLAKEIW